MDNLVLGIIRKAAKVKVINCTLVHKEVEKKLKNKGGLQWENQSKSLCFTYFYLFKMGQTE